jgi:thioredoxin-dependent peroxiredoxin
MVIEAPCNHHMRMPELQEGTTAPPIRLLTDSGDRFDLQDLRGKNVVLFFYPKADTPGWTTEAREFRDAQSKFNGADTLIVGISPDPPEAQAKFKRNQELPFTLLCDTDHEVAEAYGVWKEKSMYGKKYMGIERTTFLIDKEGRIAKIFRKVKPEGHADQVYEACTI